MKINSTKQQTIITRILMGILGVAIAVYSIVLYQKITGTEAHGLNFRFYWFFYAVYMLGGKLAVSGLLLLIGIGIILAGKRKCLKSFRH